MEIYYESIYGETWKYELKDLDEQTIKLEDFEGIPDKEQFDG